MGTAYAVGAVQLALPIPDATQRQAPVRPTPAGGTGSAALVGRPAAPRRGEARPPIRREPVDAVDVMLRDFARALIATAIHVHDDMRGSGLASRPKRHGTQAKSRAHRVVAGLHDVVSSAPQNDSGAAPLATADPVVPNRSRRLAT